MKFTRDRWTTFVIALALTVTTLVAAQLLWNKFAVAKPLDTGLRDIAGVSAAAWEENKNGEITIKVTLAGVDNLAKTYGEIGDTAKRIIGRRPARIVLADNRTPELDAFYYTIHYNLQEAIFTGNFSAMADRIQTKANAAGIDARIYVDPANVYLQLAKQGAALYAVVPRAVAPPQEVK